MTSDSSRIKQQLDTLYYDTGKQACNFEVAIAYRDDDNEQKWSKWRPYLDAQADEKFITRVNNRTILDIEIVLDVDPTEDESKESMKQRYENIIHQLDKLGLRYKAYFSGSRGYHIHLLFPELRALSQEIRKQVKELIIKKYGCDMMKATEKCMIALEDALHWKTGNPKELLKEVLGKNSLSQLPDAQEYLAALEEERQEEALKRQILQQVKENVNDSHIYYTNQFADYEVLKEIARRHYAETNNLNFLVGAKTELVGKITNKVFDHPIKTQLCCVVSREVKEGEVRKIFFLDDTYDGRKWTEETEVSHDFWVYLLISNKKKYWVFSDKELDLEEHTIEGMLVECKDFAKIGMNKRIRTRTPFIFISKSQTRIIRYDSHQELIGDVAKLQLTEDKLSNFLFSKSDGKSYRHPPYFERLIGAFLFSAARTEGDYPLHLLIIAKQGTGKTFLIEALDAKMQEQQAIIEGSGITIKKLVPSFKDVIAEPGAFARGVRVLIVDEFLREVYGLGSDEIGILLNLGRNQFIVRGIPDLDVRDYQASHQALLPAFCHAEPKYQFDKLFKEHFPSQLHKYKDLKERERKQVQEWIAFFMQQSKEEQAQEQAQQDELEKAKSKAEQLEQALEQQKTQKTQEAFSKKAERDAEIIQRYKEGASQSSLARDFGLSQPGIRKILVREGVLQ